MIRDVMQAAGLEVFAEVGILLFLLSFLMILAVAFFGFGPGAIAELERAPLKSDAPDPGGPRV